MEHRAWGIGKNIADCGFRIADLRRHRAWSTGEEKEVESRRSGGQRDFQTFKFQVKSGSLVGNAVLHPYPWPLIPELSFERLNDLNDLSNGLRTTDH